MGVARQVSVSNVGSGWSDSEPATQGLEQDSPVPETSVRAPTLRQAVRAQVRTSARTALRFARPVLAPAATRVRRFLLADLQRQIDLELNHVVHLLNQVERSANDLDRGLASQIESFTAMVIQQIQIEAELRRHDQSVDRDAVIAAIVGRIDNERAIAVAQITAALDVALQPIHEREAALLRRFAVSLGDGVVLIRTSVGYVLCHSEDTRLLAGLIDSGDSELGTRRLIERLLRPGDCFVDVGANVGMHTLAGARAVGPSGLVVAIEPFPETAQLLRRSIDVNGFADVVVVHVVGAAATSGSATLYLGESSAHHSLYAYDGAGEIAIQLVQLDELLPDSKLVHLIKIDVEGAELDVVSGARGLIERCPDVGIVVEFGPSHLDRAEIDTDAWFDAFDKLNLTWRMIDPMSGATTIASRDEIATQYSTNLLFARADSPIWQRADG